MQLVLFSKNLPGDSIEELATQVKSLGFDSIELPVRPGYQCPPQRAASDLLPTIERLGELGVTVPIVTAPVLEPEETLTREIYDACGEAGVRFIRPGYWHVGDGLGYWDLFAQAQRQVKGLEELSRSAGVKTAIHVHSGSFLTPNCAATYRLIEECDPDYVGIYLSPPHMAIDGERVEIGLGIVGDRLMVVDHKNFAWVKQEVERQREPQWERAGVASWEGLVNWPQVIELLRRVGYDDIICFHPEYSDRERMNEMVAADRAYIAGLL